MVIPVREVVMAEVGWDWGREGFERGNILNGGVIGGGDGGD